MKNNYFSYFRLNAAQNILFIALIFSLPLINEGGFLTFEAGFTVFPAYVLAILTMLVFTFLRIKKNERLISKTGIDKNIFFFILILVLSIFQSRFIRTDLYTPILFSTSFFTKVPYWRSITQVGAIIFMVMIFYLTCSIVNNELKLRQAVKYFIVTSTIVCVLTLISVVVLKLTDQEEFRKSFFSLFIMDPHIFGIRGLRVKGLATEPLIFGTYLTMVLPITIAAFFTQWFKKFWIFLAVTIQFFTIILTFSRGAWLGLLVAILFLFFYNFKFIANFLKKQKKVLIFLITLLILTSTFYSNLIHKTINRFSNNPKIALMKEGTIEQIKLAFNIEYIKKIKKDKNTNVSNLDWGTLMRLNDIIAGVNMFKDHPILGIGWGNYIYHYLQYDPQIVGWWWFKDPSTKNRPGTPVCNNLYISTAAETGIFGFISLILLIFSIFALSFKANISAFGNKNVKLILSGFVASFAGGLICYNFFTTFYYPFFWFILGLLMASVNIIQKNTKEKIITF